MMLTPWMLGLTVASSPPKIFWVSEPVLPGEVAVIAFARPANTTTTAQPVRVLGKPRGGNSWTALDTQGVTLHGVAATIPASWPVGEFQLRLPAANATTGAHTTSVDAYTVNVPRPWFLFGDQGSFSTTGGWVRVVGDAIGLTAGGGGARLFITVGGDKKVIQVVAEPAATASAPPGSSPSRSHAYFRLPSDLGVGVYRVAVANSGASGATATPLCTFVDEHTPCLSTLNISTAPTWKAEVFTVNATQPGIGHDATAAVQSAVRAANANGGGTVFFPLGQ
jgi:hypothetical protein